MRTNSVCLAIACSFLSSAAVSERANTPTGLPKPGGAPIAVIHAEGAQVYQCMSDGQGGFSWHFREPIATLLQEDRTVGRHYAGPRWEFEDGTAISAQVVAQFMATPGDIPHLMLTVTAAKGVGPLAFARTVVRLNTKGGVATGECSTPGTQLSVPYAADYAFFDAVRDN